MKPKRFAQLTLNFSVLKVRTKVRVIGYDCYGFIDLTGTIGVVDLYCSKTGNYLIYFKGKSGIVPGNPLILPYKRDQLEVITGRGRCSWERLVEKSQREERSRS